MHSNDRLFPCPVGNITADILRAVLVAQPQNLKPCEGWTLEFKSGDIDSRKLAKSVSAFANSMGGWLVWGVDSDKKHNTANDIPGILLSGDLQNRVETNHQ